MYTQQFLKNLAGSKLFSITYTKKSNGKTTKAVYRFGVKKGLNGKGMRYSREEKGIVGVYKCSRNPKNTGFRSLVIENIKEVKIKGVVYTKQDLELMYLMSILNNYNKKYYTEKKPQVVCDPNPAYAYAV